ncbi:MAG: hypothetical protein ACXQTW_00795 [Candidatus Methanospirareceae archaeon]
MDLATRISNLLAYFRNEELHFEVYCDKEGIRIYLPNGIELEALNEIAEILRETIGVEPVDLGVFKADEGEMVCLAFFDGEGELDCGND